MIATLFKVHDISYGRPKSLATRMAVANLGGIRLFWGRGQLRVNLGSFDRRSVGERSGHS